MQESKLSALELLSEGSRQRYLWRPWILVLPMGLIRNIWTWESFYCHHSEIALHFIALLSEISGSYFLYCLITESGFRGRPGVALMSLPALPSCCGMQTDMSVKLFLDCLLFEHKHVATSIPQGTFWKILLAGHFFPPYPPWRVHGGHILFCRVQAEVGDCVVQSSRTCANQSTCNGAGSDKEIKNIIVFIISPGRANS